MDENDVRIEFRPGTLMPERMVHRPTKLEVIYSASKHGDARFPLRVKFAMLKDLDNSFAVYQARVKEQQAKLHEQRTKVLAGGKLGQ